MACFYNKSGFCRRSSAPDMLRANHRKAFEACSDRIRSCIQGAWREPRGGRPLGPLPALLFRTGLDKDVVGAADHRTVSAVAQTWIRMLQGQLITGQSQRYDAAIQRSNRLAVSRRQLGTGLLSGIAAVLQAGSAGAADLTPYERGFMLEYGLSEGRVRSCPSDVNPNCVSSASLNDASNPSLENSYQAFLVSGCKKLI
jgi:hypothetical protein